jgi:hypothetical protein
MENPSEREFARDGDALKEEVKRDRSKWLAACYTILTAYHNSFDQVRVKTSAGFETWCSTVSAALVWLGCEDVIASQALIRAEDPATADLHALAEVWLELFNEQEITVQQLHNGTCAYDSLDTECKEHAEARVALTALLGRIAKGRNDALTAIGNWLARYKGRVVGAHQLLKAATVAHSGGAKWQWVRIDPQSPPPDTKPRARKPLEPAPASAAPIKPKPTSAESIVVTPVPAWVDEPAANGANGASHPEPVDPRKTLISEMGVSPTGKPLGPNSAAELVAGGFTDAQKIASAEPQKLMALGPKYTAANVAQLQRRAQGFR